MEKVIEDFIVRKSTADDGKITYVVLDACDGYGNATQSGGAVREFCDTWDEAINFREEEA
jgi:hypothetical protein